MAMKTRSLGIAFAALLALAPVRGSAQEATSPAAASPAATPADPPASVPRPSIVPKQAEDAAPAVTDAKPRKPRRYARKHYRRYAYWEPFPVFLPNIHRHHISWRRVAWFRWF
jgi:hypothetical protein